MKIVLLLLVLVIISISKCEIINTPAEFYKLNKVNRFEFLNTKIYQNNNNSLLYDMYYPDVCNNTIRNNAGSTILEHDSFPGSPITKANIMISKDSSMVLKKPTAESEEFINILCIEGSLDIGMLPIKISALVILPGGSISCVDCRLQFVDLNPSNSLIDPFKFFPGILALGGSLSFISSKIMLYTAKRIDDSSLLIPDLVTLTQFNGYNMTIYSDHIPNGQTSTFSFYLNQLTFTGFAIPSDDKNIVVFFSNPTTPSIFSTSVNSSSIYITGDTIVYIENYLLNSFGKTTNDNYNDTKLVFSPDESNKVTDIIMGTNQRFRNSLYVEFSNNVIIKNCAIIEKSETRSPLLFLASKVNLFGNLISSKSGSSVIAEFGTELIQSSNNYFFISNSDSNLILNPSPLNMDYGYEGNGFYSLSPHIESSNDVFIGHKNAFKFNFITNRSQITGFDKDCYSPCNNNSVLVSSNSQFPVDFQIKNPRFTHILNSNESSNYYLLNINNNGNDLSRYFAISNLFASDPILIELSRSIIVMDKLTTNGRFSIDGNVKRLDIINSNLGTSSLNNGKILNLNSTAFIRNSYVHSGNSIEQSKSNTPYYYNNTNYSEQVKVVSIFPNEPYRVISNTTLNVIIQLQLISTIPANSLICVFSSDSGLITKTIRSLDLITNRCNFPLSVDFEGSFNLQVEIKSSSIQTDEYIYLILFPLITSFNQYSFYSGWAMIDTNQNEQITVGGTNFTKGCQQTDGSCTLSNNIKYTTGLPIDYTKSTDYKFIFSSGITTTIENQPVTITTSINDTAKIYQVQLFFTLYQPNEAYPSLLSVNIENQAVLILEPIQTTGTPFKNVTFIYQNTGSLDKLSIEFITRGDIYLTSMAIYSSVQMKIIIPPIDFTPNNNNNNNNTTLILAITLSIGLTTILAVSIVLFIFIKRYLKFRNQKKGFDNLDSKKDVELNNIIPKKPNLDLNSNNTLPLLKTEESIQQQAIVKEIQQEQQQNDEQNQEFIQQLPVQLDMRIPYENPKPQLLENQSLALVESSQKQQQDQQKEGEKPDEVLEEISSILEKRKSAEFYLTNPFLKPIIEKSQFYENNDPSFPFEFDKTTLDFNLKHTKCKINKPYLDTIKITNISEKSYYVYIILLTDNDSIVTTVDKTLLEIKPKGVEYVNVVVTLTCTTKCYEKVTLQIESSSGKDQGLSHTFFYLHIESELTIRLDPFETIYEERIGEGTFGAVFRGKWRDVDIAIKSIKKQTILIQGEDFNKEIDIMNRIKHPNILSFIGFTVLQGDLCIISELAPYGSLGSYIRNNKNNISIKQKLRFGLDIAKGCAFLHNNGVFHRDLKPDNLLVFDPNPDAVTCVKIADFGSSRETNDLPGKFTRNVGTLIYKSNEILEDKMYNKSTDVYSFGMLFYEIMIEKTPYSEIPEKMLLPGLVVNGYRPTLGMDKINYEIRNTITRCWAKDNRPTFDQICATFTYLLKKYGQ